MSTPDDPRRVEPLPPAGPTMPSRGESVRPGSAPRGILSPGLALTTIGTAALITLSAFESLAVTTIMPVVSDELDGAALYSLAFAAPIASSVVGMVGAGAWADRRGPTRPLVAAIVVFTIGLVIAGIAASMPALVAGRFVQGFGSGAMTVAIYVLVARIYPGALHPRIFAAYAAAWVVPSMVGPLVAGIVADTVGWRWVFLGVVALVGLAGIMVAPALRSLASRPDARDSSSGNSDSRAPASASATAPSTASSGASSGASGTASSAATSAASDASSGAAPNDSRRPLSDAARLVLGAGAAVAVVAVSLSGELDAPARWIAAAAALLATAALVRPLLPAGTFVARPGLPAAVLIRGLIAASFFAAEVYLPLLLHDEYGMPPWLSGVTLTAGAIAWASGSAVQGRYGVRVPDTVFVRAGAVLLLVGTTVQVATAGFGLHPVVAVVGWFLAGGGMGLMYPRTTTIVLASSARGEEGRNTSALSLSEAAGASASLAVAGLVFTTTASLLAGTGPFVAALGYTAVLAVVSVLASGLVGAGRTGAASTGRRG